MKNRLTPFLLSAFLALNITGCADQPEPQAQVLPVVPVSLTPPTHLELALDGRYPTDFAPRGLLIDGDDIRSIQYDGQIEKGCHNGFRVAWYKSWSYFPVTDGGSGHSSLICESDKAVGVIINGKAVEWGDDYKRYATPWNNPAAIQWRLAHQGITVLASGKGQFNRPTGIAIGPQGHVWVVDSGNNRVQEFDGNGTWLRAIGEKGSAQGQFLKPTGIAVDTNGDVWVVDTGNNRVQQFDAGSGTYKNQIGGSGTGPGQLNAPEGVAVDAKGDVWVADTGNARVEKFTASGVYKGEERGFHHPAGLAFDKNNNMWAMDIDQVNKFSDTGTWLQTVGANNADEMFEPAGISVDNEGNLWTAQGILRRAVKFGSNGKKLQTIKASRGSQGGQFENFAALAVDKDGNLWAVDSFNNQLQKFDSKGNWVKTVGG